MGKAAAHNPVPAAPGSLGGTAAAAKLIQKFWGRRGERMAGQRAAELSPPAAAGARGGWSRPARRGRGDSAVPPPGAAHPPAPLGVAPAGCSLRSAAAAPSHPIPSRPGKHRTDFSNSLKCGRGVRLPRVSATVRSRSRRSALPDPLRDAGSLTPPLPEHGGDAGAAGPRARQRRDGDRRCRLRSRCGGGGKSPCSRRLPLPQARTRRCCAGLRAGRAAGCAARRAGRLPGAAPYF